MSGDGQQHRDDRLEILNRDIASSRVNQRRGSSLVGGFGGIVITRQGPGLLHRLVSLGRLVDVTL